MKDFDFDEIDRAVNSVISNAPPENSAPDTTVTALPTIPQAAPQTPQPPIAKRSGGPFMDVVHPSSDMRRPINVPDRPASAAPAQPAMTDSTPEPVSQPAVSPADSYDDADIDKITNDINQAIAGPDSTIETPFISDAKVEKRPLGAFSDNSSVEEQPKADSVNFAAQPVVEENAMITPGETPLPAELQSDLLKIEGSAETEAQTEETKPEEKTTEVNKPESVNEAKSESTESPRDVAEKAVPVVPVSINQQYAEKPGTTDQQPGAIYDTNSYHKALMPTKKKSGWMWVVLTLVLLLIGIGVGAAVYYFVIPLP